MKDTYHSRIVNRENWISCHLGRESLQNTYMSIRCNSKLSPTFPAGIYYTSSLHILLPPWKQARARDYQSGGNSFGRGGFSPARFPTWLTSTECSVFSLAFIITCYFKPQPTPSRLTSNIFMFMLLSPFFSLYIYADDVFISTSSAASAQYPADNSIDTRFIIIQTGRGRFTLQDRIKKKDAVSFFRNNENRIRTFLLLMDVERTWWCPAGYSSEKGNYCFQV